MNAHTYVSLRSHHGGPYEGHAVIIEVLPVLPEDVAHHHQDALDAIDGAHG